MADHVRTDVSYYPPYCHKAAPTFFTWVKLGVADVRRLTQPKEFEGQAVYFYNNLPIQYICLAGIIVSRDEQIQRTILLLDDSTGHTIEIVCSKPSRPAAPPPQGARNGPDLAQLASANITAASRKPLDISSLQVGVVAKFKGTITCFRGLLQLHLESFLLLPDTNAEVKFWEERNRFFVQILSIPWSLSAEEREKLRMESVHEEELRRRKKIASEAKRGEREKRIMEKAERDRRRIENRYAREEVLRKKYADITRRKNLEFRDRNE